MKVCCKNISNARKQMRGIGPRSPILAKADLRPSRNIRPLSQGSLYQRTMRQARREVHEVRDDHLVTSDMFHLRILRDRAGVAQARQPGNMSLGAARATAGRTLSFIGELY